MSKINLFTVTHEEQFVPVAEIETESGDYVALAPLEAIQFVKVRYKNDEVISYEIENEDEFNAVSEAFSKMLEEEEIVSEETHNQ